MPTNLERQTSTYWFISSIWNERVHGGLTIEDGLQACNQVIDNLGPDKRVRYKAERLLGEIIQHEQPRRDEPADVFALVSMNIDNLA